MIGFVWLEFFVILGLGFGAVCSWLYDRLEKC
jgi:hypothetical protein